MVFRGTMSFENGKISYEGQLGVSKRRRRNGLTCCGARTVTCH